ncbi:MAG: tetratricopeptide repeat protein [Candidatus Scalindua sp.]|jgi:Tfp pilus assembly protein PilF|nr:tetratricopeptide repeat protein [Candidatus Scalindua sp.]MBT7213277.1 tetratricopeptide repeat protein [Candidatus Scalindua sp.]
MGNTDNLFQQAFKYHQAGDLTNAAALYLKTLKQHPDHVEATFLIGTLYLQTEDLGAAGIFLRKAISLKSDHAPAYNNLGTVLKGQGALKEAVGNYKRSLIYKPDYAMAHSNLGNALKEQGRFDEAEVSCRQAILLKPDYADAYNNLGSVLQKQNRHEEAIVYYSNAIKLKPDDVGVHINRSLALLLTENFKEGWPEYEWRLHTKNCATRTFKQPRWDGSPLNGKSILVHVEQGFGDSIQFVRYLPMVQALGGYVVFECPKNLLRLLENCAGIDKIIEKESKSKVIFDTHIHLLSLPGIFDTSLDNMPADIPYIEIDPEPVKHWRTKLCHSNDFKIGIVWKGRPTYKDQYRSCSLADFAPLAEIPGLKIYSLQKGPASNETLNPPEGMNITCLDEYLNDFADTSAVIENLDLVISTDTAVVHLAGAMGKPVWTLLHSAPDWRWFLKREYSPWYPGMRLFRQSKLNDWTGVFEEVKSALLQEISACVKDNSNVEVLPV